MPENDMTYIAKLDSDERAAETFGQARELLRRVIHARFNKTNGFVRHMPTGKRVDMTVYYRQVSALTAVGEAVTLPDGSRATIERAAEQR